MPKPMAMVDQYPVRGLGNAGQDGFVGLHQVYFHGATGLIGSAFGIPGITVTRTGTGAYSITYPSVSDKGRCAILADIQCPTGQSYSANVVSNFPNSGTARVNITRSESFIGSGAVPVSGTVRQYNPVSGTVLNLLFFGSPVAKF